MLKSLLASAIVMAAVARPLYAMEDPAVQRGRTFARVNCSKCHSIDRVTASPLKIAPPFRTLHKRYPVDTLAEALVEGIYTGHPSMPEFQFDPGQVNDLIAFLKSLEGPSHH